MEQNQGKQRMQDIMEKLILADIRLFNDEIGQYAAITGLDEIITGTIIETGTLNP